MKRYYLFPMAVIFGVIGSVAMTSMNNNATAAYSAYDYAQKNFACDKISDINRRMNLQMIRCENEEIVCYIKSNRIMKCKWKEDK